MAKRSTLPDGPLPAVAVYTVGFIYASACVAKGTPRQAIEDAVNAEHMTGISSRWAISDAKFSAGESNPCQCPDHADREHYLLNC